MTTKKPPRDFRRVCRERGRDPDEFPTPAAREGYMRAYYRTDERFRRKRESNTTRR